MKYSIFLFVFVMSHAGSIKAAGASIESLKQFEGSYQKVSGSSAVICSDSLNISFEAGPTLVVRGASYISNFTSINSGQTHYARTYVGEGKTLLTDSSVRSTGKRSIKEEFSDGYAFNSYSGSRTLSLSNDGQTLSYRIQSVHQTRDEFGSSIHWTTRNVLNEKCVYRRL